MRVAITGGIGEGKSTVLGYVRDLGFLTSSADDVARSLFEDSAVNARLAELAGTPAPITRSDLRTAIAAQPELRRKVNALMHPLIRRAIHASGAEFVEVPLLIETCGQGEYERVWVVTCDEALRKARLMARYGSSEHVNALIASQLPSEAKTPFADAVFRTNQPEEAVRELVAWTVSRSL